MQTHCACSSRRRTEMRYLQSFLLMLLLCLPAAMPAMAAEGDADAVATATRLLDHMQAGEYEAATADFTAQMKDRSEEHTSELQSLMRISYAVFCLTKKKTERTSY